MKRYLAWLLLCGLLALHSALAGEYPEKPVTLVVMLPAGGPTDAAARVLADALSSALGQPFVIENRPGADGVIGVRAVLDAPADGYTLLFGIGSLVAVPMLQTPAPFDLQRDFVPVAAIGSYPFGLFVHPSVPANSVAELIAYAKSREEPLFYASSTPGETLATAEFMQATGVRMSRVPYKGFAQALPDLLAGRVQLAFGPVSAALAHVQDGKLRLLATLTPTRLPALPTVPTLEEAGVRGASVPSWQAIFAPAQTPAPIVERLSRAVAAALQTDAVRTRLGRLLLQIEMTPPAALTERISREHSRWQHFIEETGTGRP